MPVKHKEIRKMVNRLGVSILCLVETLVKQFNFDRIVSSMLLSWEVIHNYSAHYLGRVWICWDLGGSYIKAIDVHEQVITCHVNSVNMGRPWMCLCDVWCHSRVGKEIFAAETSVH